MAEPEAVVAAVPGEEVVVAAVPEVVVPAAVVAVVVSVRGRAQAQVRVQVPVRARVLVRARGLVRQMAPVRVTAMARVTARATLGPVRPMEPDTEVRQPNRISIGLVHKGGRKPPLWHWITVCLIEAIPPWIRRPTTVRFQIKGFPC